MDRAGLGFLPNGTENTLVSSDPAPGSCENTHFPSQNFPRLSFPPFSSSMTAHCLSGKEMREKEKAGTHFTPSGPTLAQRAAGSPWGHGPSALGLSPLWDHSAGRPVPTLLHVPNGKLALDVCHLHLPSDPAELHLPPDTDTFGQMAALHLPVEAGAPSPQVLLPERLPPSPATTRNDGPGGVVYSSEPLTPVECPSCPPVWPTCNCVSALKVATSLSESSRPSKGGPAGPCRRAPLHSSG